ncbi:hypothetical protein K435DRAFT_872124 [Dendrothele bispora CBS 962.96]|uniref:Uncharacterized protein n=1 Tax=Dendrothele bispora (strain CBS 962.96) TaxID=1314807 RepID=A0A4S8L2C5_DENBC|nr:hypothetical protein K435DRAFT_872124 [Dendrothele bispora CBS 962.96]
MPLGLQLEKVRLRKAKKHADEGDLDGDNVFRCSLVWLTMSRTGLLDLLDIVHNAHGRVQKEHRDNLTVGTRLLAALGSVRVSRTHDNFLLDCVKGEICDTVELVGDVPKIECVASATGYLTVLLDWEGYISGDVRAQVRESLENPVVKALVSKHLLVGERMNVLLSSFLRLQL